MRGKPFATKKARHVVDVEFFLSSFVILFSVVDPVGNVPVFLGMTTGDSEARRRHYASRATLTAVLTLLFFLLFGQGVFQLFDITLPAFQIAGGIILLIIALDLLQATHSGVRLDNSEVAEGMEKTDISITPLGIPLLGGPAAITTVIVLSSQRPGYEGVGIVAVVIVAVGASCYIALRSASRLSRLLGVTGIHVTSRLMGLILLAMSVQYLLNGLGGALPLMLEGVVDQ